MKFRRTAQAGAALLVVLGVGHAIRVALGDDVEPYLWGVSLFLVAQGVLTLIALGGDRAAGKRQ